MPDGDEAEYRPPAPFARRGRAHVVPGHSSASSIVRAFFVPLVFCRTVGFGSNAALMGAACHTRPAEYAARARSELDLLVSEYAVKAELDLCMCADCRVQTMMKSVPLT